jgi:MraZ protein
MGEICTFEGQIIIKVVPFDLVGQYTCRLDDKGRLKLPSELLAQLGPDHGETFVLNRSIEQCLILYPKIVWEQFTEQLKQISDFSPSGLKFKRAFYRDSHRMVKDASGRVLMSRLLLDYAGIDRDITLICEGNKVEIWDTQTVEQDRMNQEDFTNLAQNIFGGMYLENK